MNIIRIIQALARKNVIQKNNTTRGSSGGSRSSSKGKPID